MNVQIENLGDFTQIPGSFTAKNQLRSNLVVSTNPFPETVLACIYGWYLVASWGDEYPPNGLVVVSKDLCTFDPERWGS